MSEIHYKYAQRFDNADVLYIASEANSYENTYKNIDCQ